MYPYRRPSGQAESFTQAQVLAARELHDYVMRTAASSRNRDYVRERQRIMGGIGVDGGVARETAQRIFDITGLRIPGIEVTTTPRSTPTPTPTPTQPQPQPQPQVTPRTKPIGEQAQITFSQPMTGNTPTPGSSSSSTSSTSSTSTVTTQSNPYLIPVAIGVAALLVVGGVYAMSRRSQEYEL